MSPRRVVNRSKPVPLGSAIAVSLLGHVLLLSLIFSGQGLGVPGLGWPERRAEAREPHVVLLPPRAVSSAPAVREPRPPVVNERMLAPRTLDLPAQLRDETERDETERDEAERAEAKVAASPVVPAATPTRLESVQEPLQAPVSPPLASGDVGSQGSTPPAVDKPATVSVTGPAPTSVPEAAPQIESSPQSALAAEPTASGPEVAPTTPAQNAASVTEEADKAMRARELEQRELERQAREAQERQAAREAAEQREAADRIEAARLEAERATQARLEDERLAALRAAALKDEAARQEAARQAAQQMEAAQRESERQEAIRRQAAQEDARREAIRRAMGRQLDEEAAQREAAAKLAAANPTSPGGKRRGRLLGRTDANPELVLYAEAWARKIQLNTRPDRVRSIAQRPHTAPLVNVAIRSDGSLESITFVMSSGVAEIDQAVRDLVRELLPYSPFPPALARDFDVIEIRRSWQFDTAVRLH